MRKIINQLSYILSAKEKGKIVFLFFLMLIGGLLEMAGVSLVLPMISIITKDQDQAMGQITFFAIAFIVLYIGKNLFLIFMYDSIFRFVYNGAANLSGRMMKAYLNVDYSFHLSRNVSEIERAVRNDSEGVYRLLKSLLQLLSEAVICLILVIFLLFTDIWMSLFLMVLIGSVCGLFLAFSKAETKRLGIEEHESVGQTERWILQAFGGIKEVKILGKEEFFLDRVIEYRNRSAKTNRKQQVMLQIPRLLVETVCIVGVMCIILLEVALGRNMIDLLPKMGVFAVAAFRLLPSVGKINALLGEALFLKASSDAVYEDLKELESIHIRTDMEADEKSVLPMEWNKTISAIDLSFKYSKDGPYVLRHCAIDIPFGSAVGLIGPSGAGKTTLVDILMGMIQPTEGSVLVDGKDIYENIRSWQKQIGYVPQNIYLTDDTIRANVAFGLLKEEIDDERVWESLRQAQLEAFIRDSADGLDTMVGDRGVRLSGGQRQRIGIARALYHNPQLLIFDEATSALDNETEEAVMQAIEALHGSKTMIIIAHRLSTIENCDIVYRVYNTKIEKQ